MTAASKTSYVTTSIPYVNAKPHLGHALEFCIADAFARHRRLRGHRVRFVTGTDDHSLKNVLAAERAGVPTNEWVARHAAAFEELNAALDISADDFQRTSASPAHAPAVRAPVRYFLLRHIRTARDGDFSVVRFRAAHDAELANGLGNLTSRVLALAEEVTGGRVPAPGPELAEDRPLRAAALALRPEVDAAVDRLSLDEALSAVFRLVDATNRYVTTAAPWRHAREGRSGSAAAAVRTALEALRVIAAELAPFLPGTSNEIRTRLGAPALDGPVDWNVLPTGAQLSRGSPLFQRLG